MASGAESEQGWKINIDILQSIAESAAKYGEDLESIPQWAVKVHAPVPHKFGAGVEGVTGQDVAKAVARDKSLLDRSYGGCTPLDLAIACDNVGRLESLIQMGADPNNRMGMMTELTRINAEAGNAYTVLFLYNKVIYDQL